MLFANINNLKLPGLYWLYPCASNSVTYFAVQLVFHVLDVRFCQGHSCT